MIILLYLHTTIIVPFTLYTLIEKPCSTKAIPSITLSMSNRSSIKIKWQNTQSAKTSLPLYQHYCHHYHRRQYSHRQHPYHQSYVAYTKKNKTRILEAVKSIKTQKVKREKKNSFNILQYLHTLISAEFIRWIISSSGHRETLA